MKSFGRQFTCARCNRQVVLCPRCDRGNIYCSRGCSSEARRQSQRRAGQRYQDTFRGRRKHAQRQKRYRDRCRHRVPGAKTMNRKQKVTHHPLTGEGGAPVVSRMATTRPERQTPGARRPAGALRCHRCGRFCARFVPPGLRSLRHRPRER